MSGEIDGLGRVRHAERVARIARQLEEAGRSGRRVHFSKQSGHHVVPLPGDRRFRDPPVDISELCHVVELDPAARRCVAEPAVTFRDLLALTLRHGLMPAVVPELEGITLGGAVAGCSIESTSFSRGGFHDSCEAYELIAGDGRVLGCSRTTRPDLFEMIHGSYGTLALVSSVSFELVPAAPYVGLQYLHLTSFPAFEAELRRLCVEGEQDFLDAIVHGPDHFVICTGRFATEVPYASDYRRRGVYYRSTAERQTDFLTTADYCFRFDADCHWLTRSIPPLEWAAVRRLLGSIVLGSGNLIRWSGRLSRLLALKRRPDVVCDVFIPGGRFEELWRWYERVFSYYPLWVVPYRIPAIYPWVADEHARRMREVMPDNLVFDCAVYGKPNRDPGVDWSQVLEEQTFRFDGIKTLISRNHYSEERFWQIYDRPRYTAAKSFLDPTGALPDLFEKLHRVG